MRFMVVVMMVVAMRRCWPGTRKCCCELESEFSFLGVGFQTVVVVGIVAMVMEGATAAFVGLFLLAVFAFVAVTPDVVALQLAGLVADGEGPGRLDWAMGGRVGIVVIAIIFVIGESDEARSLGVAPDNGAEGGRWGALAGASAGEVEVRHCFRARPGVGWFGENPMSIWRFR
jgi:hypothetical protein